MTFNDHVVRYQEHVSTKSYEELVAAFEEAVPEPAPDDGRCSRTANYVLPDWFSGYHGQSGA